MAQAGAGRPPAAPWSFRLFELVPLPPVWVGIGLAAALFAVYYGVEYATGQIHRVRAGTAEPHIAGHLRSAAINALLFAYLPTAQIYLTRWTRRHVAELQPLLRPQRGADAQRPEAGSLASPASRMAGAAGVAMVLAIFVVPSGLGKLTDTGYWVFEHLWDNGLAVLIGWLVGRFLYAMVADALYVSRLAERLATVDLLDPAPLQPFVRQGTRGALLTVVFLTINAGHLGNFVISAPALAVTLPALLALAGAALVLPLGGVHRRIREEKRVRLAKLRDAIRAGERAALAGGAKAQRAAADLPGLLALEARLEAVREWPIDATSVLRVALYVAIGLGSWVGAAGVERLLDRALA